MFTNTQFPDKMKRLNRSGSVYVQPRISQKVIEKSEKIAKSNSAIHLKERGILRHMIQNGEVGEARALILHNFKVMYEVN